jgi:hypothetical protein
MPALVYGCSACGHLWDADSLSDCPTCGTRGKATGTALHHCHACEVSWDAAESPDCWACGQLGRHIHDAREWEAHPQVATFSRLVAEPPAA